MNIGSGLMIPPGGLKTDSVSHPDDAFQKSAKIASHSCSSSGVSFGVCIHFKTTVNEGPPRLGLQII